MSSPSLAVQVVVVLLLVACLVAVWLRPLRIPYTVGLVGVGIAVNALGYLPATTLSPDVFLWMLLPPLLFEAAFTLRWDHLVPVASAIAVLATLGVILSASITAAIVVLATRIPWPTAVLFGVLVAATDPVAVVAFFQRARVAPGLRALVEGESLVNDGTAVVLVGVLGTFLASGQIAPGAAVLDFFRIAGGGLLVGCGVGFVGSVLASRTDDFLVEATLSVVIAYGSYLVGDGFGVSGVLAVVGAGSVLGNFGRRFGLSARTNEEIDDLWQFLAFVANSLVFLLLGAAVVPRGLVSSWGVIAVGVAATLLGRAAAAYGLGGIVARFTRIPPLPWRHVLFWGGLRGALPVVIAIAVVSDLHQSSVLADLVLGVVVVTLLAQGITLDPVLHRVLRTSRAPQ